MTNKTQNIDALLVLIRLLKAEGVKEYSENGLSLHFYPEEHTSFGGPIQLGREESTEGSKEGDSDASPPEIELPPALKKLNSNYLKLTGVVPNTRRAK